MKKIIAIVLASMMTTSVAFASDSTNYTTPTQRQLSAFQNVESSALTASEMETARGEGWFGGDGWFDSVVRAFVVAPTHVTVVLPFLATAALPTVASVQCPVTGFRGGCGGIFPFRPFPSNGRR